ncbi:MAG: GerW family sporulation protein [Firmicutes bacterium]|jgi:sporulation protein YtfJ|nr:GerW family sporulation protein [Bacillota bacterium]
MPEHPIDGLMKTTLDSIAQMVDVNTIMGDPVETPDGNVIMPVSRVSFGFAAGGTDWCGSTEPNAGATAGNGGTQSPFGGGSGAGISLHPVGFLVVGRDQVRFLPVNGDAILDRLLDVAPELIARVFGTHPKPKTMQVQCEPTVPPS